MRSGGEVFAILMPFSPVPETSQGHFSNSKLYFKSSEISESSSMTRIFIGLSLKKNFVAIKEILLYDGSHEESSGLSFNRNRAAVSGENGGFGRNSRSW